MAEKVERDVLRYKWEFLRRNSKYQRDYKRRDRLQESYWLKKYGIGSPLDPSYVFNGVNIKAKDLHLFDLNPLPAVTVVGFQDTPLNYKDFEKEFLIDTSDFDRHKASVVVVKIDLRVKREKTIKEFKKKLTIWRKNCGVLNLSKPRFGCYKEYLDIFDLYASKKTFRKIAARVYSKLWTTTTTGSTKKDIIRKVKENLVACKKLIDGGYKEIC